VTDPTTPSENPEAVRNSPVSGKPSTKDEAQRRFFERLTDWSDPNALTLIRRGDGAPIPANPTSAIIVDDVVVNPVPVTVVSVDEDGNMLMSDGSMRVP
jgi:hypothetical protein